MTAKVSEAEFIAAWNATQCSPRLTAQKLGINERAVYKRRANLAAKGIELPTVPSTPTAVGASKRFAWSVPHEPWTKRRTLDVKDGVVIIFSDPHFYPDVQSVAYRALLELIAALKPRAVICGGDALDGTQISRWDPTRGFHEPPALAEQLHAMQTSMDAIERAARKARRDVSFAWTLGNHDARLSRYLAVQAPHVKDLPGTELTDYCPRWPLSWTVEINGNTIVRHRPLGGMLHLRGVKAGCHFAHGHLHQLNAHQATQYHRRLWSIDCGSLAANDSDAFDYSEDAPPHAEGFMVLTYRDGHLLWPEPCYVEKGRAIFRSATV